jgi:hypothetical protein
MTPILVAAVDVAAYPPLPSSSRLPTPLSLPLPQLSLPPPPSSQQPTPLLPLLRSDKCHR